jgi:hypothetical protein
MLPGVQEHPHPSRRRSGQQAREYRTATHTRVVLLDCRVFHATTAIERQRVVRLGMGRLPIKIRARRARLNPEFHSSSRQMCCIAGPKARETAVREHDHESGQDGSSHCAPPVVEAYATQHTCCQ